MTAKTRCTQTRMLHKNTFCVRQVFSRAWPRPHRLKVAEGLTALCQGVSSARTWHICPAWWGNSKELSLSWISAISGYFLLAGRCRVWVTNVWPALCKSPPRGVYLSRASVMEYAVCAPVLPKCRCMDVLAKQPKDSHKSSTGRHTSCLMGNRETMDSTSSFLCIYQENITSSHPQIMIILNQSEKNM